MAKEIWKPVVGYDGMYEVSSIGNVRGLDRVIKRCECGRPIRTMRGARLGLIMRPDGYPRVSLSRKNKHPQRCVHHLVLEAFVGRRPFGMDGCHNNGIRNDNRVSNLRWDTRKNNIADQAEHGTKLLGEHTNSVKLTASAVLAIRASDKKPPALASEHGVALATIQRIRARVTWKHVP